MFEIDGYLITSISELDKGWIFRSDILDSMIEDPILGYIDIATLPLFVSKTDGSVIENYDESEHIEDFNKAKLIDIDLSSIDADDLKN